jgi:excisionase family DNA binding protein
VEYIYVIKRNNGSIGRRDYIMNKLVYSITEVAKILGISKSHAYGLVKLGRLPVIELGKRKVVLRVSLERWLKENVRNDEKVVD